MLTPLPKIIVIVGPTASGKTQLAIKLAHLFNGEIVSADSRQVYKKMNIGTAKPVGMWAEFGDSLAFMVDGIPHHLMDIVDPGESFSLADFKEQALFHIYDILKRGKIPFLVGGTGLYIWSILDNLTIPHVPPQKKLRESLNAKSLPELVNLLTELDPDAAQTIDIKNPRRVIRALEVVIISGESMPNQKKKGAILFSPFQIGIRLPLTELHRTIEERIENQIKLGFVEEVRSLRKQKYSWQLPSMSSVGYPEIGEYLEDKISLEEAVEKIKNNTRHYAKRQLTWFKRDKTIHWQEEINLNKLREEIKKFLS